MRGKPPTGEQLLDYCFLTDLCNEEHEAYFPTAGPSYLGRDYFRPAGLSKVRGFWRKTLRLMRAGKAPAELGLYVHWPFCTRKCSFCFCAMCVPKGRAEMEEYARMIEREADAFRDLFKGFKFSSAYFGGGTPSHIPDDVLDRMLGHLGKCFRIAPDAEYYFESSPMTLTASKMRILRRHKVNHVTLGIQTMDPEVLKTIDRRGQTKEVVDRAYGLLLRERGLIRSIDLMYGLEGQSRKSFIQDAVWAMKKRPHNLRIYAFDPRPQTLYAAAGKRKPAEFREDQFVMMQLLDRITKVYGYRLASSHPKSSDYLCSITRQCRTARRWGASVLGLGPSSLSHAFGSAWYRHPALRKAPRGWGPILPFDHLESDLEEEMRGYCVRQFVTPGEIPRSSFREIFRKDVMDVPALASAIRDLQAAGKVRIETDAVRFLSVDRVERQVYGKHLFSPGLRRRLLSAYARERAAFLRRHRGRRPESLIPEVGKRVAALMRMFYHPSTPVLPFKRESRPLLRAS